jgi:homoserine O-acetyltransferase
LERFDMFALEPDFVTSNRRSFSGGSAIVVPYASRSDSDHSIDIIAPFPEHLRPVGVADAHVRFSSIGPLDAPVVFVLGGISASRRAAAEVGGWWGDVVRAGGAVDVSRYRVISADFFPLAPDEIATLTTTDIASVYLHCLREIGVERLHAFVGASFGGMVGLALAAAAPEFVQRLVCLCAADRAAPMALAWRRVQQQILKLAIDAGRPEEGVALARELAVTTYRTEEEFNTRFEDAAGVDGYLSHQGEKFARKMSAERYATLSGALDSHEVDPARVVAPTLLIAAESDRLVPVETMRTLAGALGGAAKFVSIPSLYGHDAFLKEAAVIGPEIEEFLKESV